MEQFTFVCYKRQKHRQEAFYRIIRPYIYSINRDRQRDIYSTQIIAQVAFLQ